MFWIFYSWWKCKMWKTISPPVLQTWAKSVHLEDHESLYKLQTDTPQTVPGLTDALLPVWEEIPHRPSVVFPGPYPKVIENTQANGGHTHQCTSWLGIINKCWISDLIFPLSFWTRFSVVLSGILFFFPLICSKELSCNDQSTLTRVID